MSSILVFTLHLFEFNRFEMCGTSPMDIGYLVLVKLCKNSPSLLVFYDLFVLNICLLF